MCYHAYSVTNHTHSDMLGGDSDEESGESGDEEDEDDDDGMMTCY